MTVEWSPGIQIRFKNRKHTVDLIRHIDGEASLAEIFQAVRRNETSGSPTDQELLAEFRPIYQVFNEIDAILLRHKSIRPFLTGSELQSRAMQSML